MENTNTSTFQVALKWGLIIGLIDIVINLVAYLINRSLLVSFWLGGSVLVVNVVMMVIAVKNRKQQLDGQIQFGEAFLFTFVTALGALFLSLVYNYVLYNFIDTGLTDYIKEQAIEKAQAMMEKFNASAEDIDKAISKMQEEDMSQTPSKILIGMLWGSLFNAIPSLIIAAIFKTKKASADLAE
jgi:hypothetical protein